MALLYGRAGRLTAKKRRFRARAVAAQHGVLDPDEGEVRVVEALLALDADANAPGNGGMTPLHEAARIGHVRTAQLLIERGARPGAAAAGGLTPLHLACRFGHEAVVRVLLQRGAPAAAKDLHGETAAGVAKRLRQRRCAALLRRFRVRGELSDDEEGD